MRSSLAFAFLVSFAVSASSVRAALQISDSCACLFDVGPARQTGPFPPSCTPSSLTIYVVSTSSSGGSCDAPPTCLAPKACSGSGYIRVVSNSPCRWKFYKDGDFIGGGTGSEQIAPMNDDVACGDFTDYRIEVGSQPVFLITNICRQCSAGTGS